MELPSCKAIIVMLLYASSVQVNVKYFHRQPWYVTEEKHRCNTKKDQSTFVVNSFKMTFCCVVFRAGCARKFRILALYLFLSIILIFNQSIFFSFQLVVNCLQNFNWYFAWSMKLNERCLGRWNWICLIPAKVFVFVSVWVLFFLHRYYGSSVI